MMLSKSFFLAGKAIFTVESKTGEWYTFKVRRKEMDGGKVLFFVSLKTDADGYTYLGVLDPDWGEVRLTAKSKYKEDSKPVKIVRWALCKVWNCLRLPEGYSIRHEGRCGRCGRKLTVPESLRTGFGPECRGYANPENNHKTEPEPEVLPELDLFAAVEPTPVPPVGGSCLKVDQRLFQVDSTGKIWVTERSDIGMNGDWPDFIAVLDHDKKQAGLFRRGRPEINGDEIAGVRYSGQYSDEGKELLVIND